MYIQAILASLSQTFIIYSPFSPLLSFPVLPDVPLFHYRSLHPYPPETTGQDFITLRRQSWDTASTSIVTRCGWDSSFAAWIQTHQQSTPD